MECVGCGSAAVSERSERTAQGYRRFRCRACGKEFNERSAGSLNRTQYPSDVIALVVLWRLRYKLALRDLPEMFLIRGIVFSHEAVRDWEAKLTPALAENLRRRRRGKAGQSWYVDETYIKVHGHWRYLYRAIDRSGALVDVMFSGHRTWPPRRRSSSRRRWSLVSRPAGLPRMDTTVILVRSERCWAPMCDIAIASISTTDWSKIIAAPRADTVRCAGSSARDQLADSAAPSTSCVTFSVPVPEPISKSPPTIAGSTSFAAPQRF